MAGNASITLNDVVDQLKVNNSTSEQTNKNLNSYFKYLERQRLDQLENQREMKKSAGASTKRDAATGTNNSSSTTSIYPMLTGLLAGLSALSLAGIGLRGWEVDAIKSLKDTATKFKTNIVGGVKNLSTGILKALGIEEVQKRDSKGRFTKGREFNVIRKIRLALDGIKADLNKIFKPIDDLGKSLKTSFAPGKGGVSTKVLKGFGTFLRTIFDGPISVIRYIGTAGTNVLGGGLTKVMKMFGGMGGTKMGGIIKSFGAKVLAILKPIGFIFSAWAGVKSYQSKKGDTYDKLGAGIGGFLGDFFGGFMNLIKSAVSWVLGKFGFKNAEKFLDGLDFNKMIKELVEGVFAFGKKTVKWFEKLFEDPGQALSDLWTGTYGKDGFLNTFIWKPLSKAFDWITKKLSWRDEDAPPFDLYTTVSGWTTDIMNWMSSTWNSTKTFFAQLPTRISLFFEDSWVKLLKEIEMGWIRFGAFVKDLPNQILIGALNSMKEFSPTAFKALGLNETLAAATDRSAVNASATSAAITSVQSNRGAQTAEVETRRKALDDQRARATAPVVVQNGGNSSSNTTNAPVNVVMPGGNDLNSSDPVIY